MRRLFLAPLLLAASFALHAQALTGTFTVTPTTANAPASVDLAWNVWNFKPSTVCTASGSWTGTKPLTGGQTVNNLLNDATYTLTCVTPAVPPVAGAGSVTLSWQPPTQNTDGSTLTNLAGFRILYGASASALSQTVQVPGAGVSAYVVDGLSSGVWFFAVKAYTAGNVESGPSNVVSKAVDAGGTPGIPAVTWTKTVTVKVSAQPKPPVLVTVEQTAYKMDNGNQNQLKVAKIGTVPLGKPCVQTISPFTNEPVDYMGLNLLKDRMVAVVTGSSRPNQILAKCDVRM